MRTLTSEPSVEELKVVAKDVFTRNFGGEPDDGTSAAIAAYMHQRGQELDVFGVESPALGQTDPSPGFDDRAVAAISYLRCVCAPGFKGDPHLMLTRPMDEFLFAGALGPRGPIRAVLKVKGMDVHAPRDDHGRETRGARHMGAARDRRRRRGRE